MDKNLFTGITGGEDENTGDNGSNNETGNTIRLYDYIVDRLSGEEISEGRCEQGAYRGLHRMRLLSGSSGECIIKNDDMNDLQ